VTVEASAGHRGMEEIGRRPARVASMAAGAFSFVHLSVKDRRLSRRALVTRQAGRGKRRVDRGRIGERPIVHDVAASAIRLSRGGLMGGGIGPQIAMACIAGSRHWFMQEISRLPTRIVPMAAGTLGFECLSVKDRRLSWLVLVACAARSREWRMELRRVRDGPVGDDVTPGTICLSRGGLVGWGIGFAIAVASVACLGCRGV
jgi:hypothetical protein